MAVLKLTPERHSRKASTKTPSLRQGLLQALLVTTATALIFACIALLTYEFFAYKETATNSLSTLAQAIAANSSALMVYDHQQAAHEVLSALRSEHSVVAAALYDNAGKLYATYPDGLALQELPPSLARDGVRFSGLRLTIFQPVTQKNARVGTLYIRKDLRGMYHRLLFYGLTMLGVMTLSAGLALLFSEPVQRRISKPILDLAALARRISGHKDFTVRVPDEPTVEELALLHRAFNEMLEQIHVRDLSLQKHAETLEQHVTERTRSLEDTTRQLYDFCHSIAHDLKAPIRAQAAYARILVEEFAEKLGAEGTGYAARILDAANRQSRIVSDLLTHVSLGRSDLPIVPVDLAATAAQVRTDLLIEIERQHAALDISHVQGRVMANPASLHLVLTNLLSNAMKFIPRGQVPRVRAWTEDHDGSVRLWVEDNGLGIPAKHIPKLFGLFQRLHTRDEYPGTGIGLALVQRAAERMGGRVGVESQEGRGSRFWVELNPA